MRAAAAACSVLSCATDLARPVSQIATAGLQSQTPNGCFVAPSRFPAKQSLLVVFATVQAVPVGVQSMALSKVAN